MSACAQSNLTIILNFHDGWIWNLIRVSFAHFSILNGTDFILLCLVSGLAKLEGEMEIENYDEEPQPTKYQLTGIVVHSGQASGGHYYSYILHR